MSPLKSINIGDANNVRNISSKKQFDPSHSVFYIVAVYIVFTDLMTLKEMKAKHRQKRSNTGPLEK